MEKIRNFAKWFAFITTGTLIVCAINFSILSSDEDLPKATLWQILLAGILTTCVTIFFTGINSKKLITLIAGYIMHYVCLCITMIICGCNFGWMQFDLPGLIMMALSVAGVYVFAFTANYIMDKKLADEINKRLEEISCEQETDHFS